MNYYITLDYELFLSSQTGTVENCLLKPTAALLGLLDKYGIKVTFFVDAAYLLRLEQLKDANPALKESYGQVCNHIRNLSEAGHSIQLHFHPQWLYSDYKDGVWVMDMAHYKLADMSDEEINRYIPQAVQLLHSLSEKPVIAFRAGGYSVMDFSRYTPLFKKLGIRIDTSVLRNKYCHSKYQNYDYTNVPLKSKYSFSDSLITECLGGEFNEYPISTAKLNGFASTLRTYLTIKRTTLSERKKWGDGKSVGMDNIGKADRHLAHLRMLTCPNVSPASIDSGAINLDKVVKSSAKRIVGENVVIIGHPKNLNPLSLKNLESFINKVGSNNFKSF